jgi:ligand-binding SRPBCC domain-containing protein
MKIYRLESSVSVPVSLREAFALFETAGNLLRVTPPEVRLRVTRGGDMKLRKGAEIGLEIRRWGLRLNWRVRIAEYEPPFFFVDEQAAGPFACWRHRHEFRPTEYGAMISDRLEYALPLGPLGRLAHRLFVRRQLEELFDYRRRAIAEILTGAPTAK